MATITTIPIDHITIGARQRTRSEARALNDLVLAIQTTGLLQPIGLWRDADEVHHLVWGGRRLAAVQKLAAEGTAIRAGSGEPVPLGDIPYLLFDPSSSEIERREAELAENTAREDLSWQERSAALAEIHLLRVDANPKQTVTETAREITAAQPPTATGSVSTNRQNIMKSLIVKDRMSDPDVAKAKGLDAAFQVVQRKDAQAAEAELVKRRMAASPAREAATPSPEPITFHNADWREVLPALPPVDLFLCDPPFGINIDDRSPERARQTNVHRYDDSPETILPMLQDFLLASFKAAKQRANLFLFCDIDHFVWLRDAASRQGWSPFRTPVVWDKLTPGIGPWHSEGFQRRYELLLFATKGAAGLRAPMPDILQHKRVETKYRVHGAQKPTSLLESLIDSTTLPGDLVVDPFAGSGSTLVAARNRSRRAVGIELDPESYNAGLSNVFGTGGTGLFEDFN